jgi:signal transduction histidine kinase
MTLEARHVGGLREMLDQLRLEVAELRASRERLVLAADASRRSIERELHDGVQQHLVALSVNLHLASALADTNPPASKSVLDEMGHDVQRALEEAARLAQRIHPPLLEAGGLVPAVRAAAASAGVSALVEVQERASYPPEVGATIYLCVLEAARATVTVRDEEGGVTFEVAVCPSRSQVVAAHSKVELDGIQDRVEALGGRLTINSEPGGIRVCGSLPLSR